MYYEKIKTSKGYIFKKVNEQKEIDKSNAYDNPESFFSDEERDMIKAGIARQQEQLKSGDFEVIERDTGNGKALSMRAKNPFDVTNYNEDDIYKQLDGRYENIFSHMNKLWCDGHGFEDCSKCSMYARMLVQVFDKINKLSGRDMSQDLCTYHKDEI